MHVSATTPDSSMTVEVIGGQTARITVSPRHYDVMSEHDLAHALQQLLRLGFVARKRAYDEMQRLTIGSRRPPMTGSRAERELHELQALVDASSAEGVSTDGAVTITASNLTNFSVVVRPGVTGLYDAEGFGASATEATNDLVGRHLRTVKGIRARYRRDHPSPF